MSAKPKRRGRSYRPLAIDLFSGCGGLTLGLKRAGFRVVGAVDCDRLAAETYKRNHRSVRMWLTDLRDLPASNVLRELGLKRGQLDLLAGCPPCQGFSAVRTLNGSRQVRDKQNRLVDEFLRFVRVLRPKAVMLENVPGLATNWRLRAFTRELRRLGYRVEHRVLNAAHFGVPQRRRRLILLAGLKGLPTFAKPSDDGPTVKQTIAHLPQPSKSNDDCHNMPEERDPRILKLIRQIPKNGGSRDALSQSDQLECHKDRDGFHDIYGRMAWDSVLTFPRKKPTRQN